MKVKAKEREKNIKVGFSFYACFIFFAMECLMPVLTVSPGCALMSKCLSEYGGRWCVSMRSWISPALRNMPLSVFTCTPLIVQFIFLEIERPSVTSSLPMSTIREGVGRWQMLNH